MGQYKPLEDYALVGNLETCGLVGRDGSVDWLPVPHVESPSLFAAVLDADRGGRFALEPRDPVEVDREYVGHTNVLRTTFHTDGGTATLTDFMPVTDGEPVERALYRRLDCTAGSVAFELTLEPRFDYARADTSVRQTAGGLLATGDGERARLVTHGGFEPTVGEGGATATVSLDARDEAWFVLQYGADAAGEPPAARACRSRLADTISYWEGWAHTCEAPDCVFDGPWHDLAVRSGLVLKLLTHREPGTVCAAPTTSLPEEVGGVRNWDYRFNWIRDAAFTVQALSNLGHRAEARAYHGWLLELCRECDPADLQPVYGLHGERDLTERTLDHLSGYRNSSPVRVGNGAAEQLQLDIYGELVLGVWETVPEGGSVDAGDWAALRDVVDHVTRVWTERDSGIWEVRGGPRHFVYSKLMCWVALDRGLALADAGGHDAPRARWREHRRRIREEVLERGYDEDVGAFRQSYGDDALDATGLLIPVVGFLPFDDPRVQGTIDAVRDRLLADDGLVRRYDGDDGLPGEEGAFCLCSCWLVDALALSGRVEEARETFTDLLAYVNDVGLLAEEVDPLAGIQLGNFPQAFSHIGIINSALYLGEATGRVGPGVDPMAVSLGEGADVPGE